MFNVTLKIIINASALISVIDFKANMEVPRHKIIYTKSVQFQIEGESKKKVDNPKTWLLVKNPQFQSDQGDILATKPTNILVRIS